MLAQRDRKPTTAGEFIQEYILDEFDMTQEACAKLLGVRRNTISRLINGHSGLSIEMARRLDILTGMGIEFWLNVQRSVDLWELKNSGLSEKLKKTVKPLAQVS